MCCQSWWRERERERERERVGLRQDIDHLEAALEALLARDQLVLEDVDHLDVLPVLDRSRSG